MIIGAVIYAVYGLSAKPVVKENDKTIVVTAGEIEWMLSSWRARWNRPPTAGEFDGLVQQYIRETVLYREALTMGLNRHDQVIRRRLAQKLEFLARDLVALTPPTEAELRAYFNLHQASYQAPALYTFTQIYFDPDKRGEATLEDAEKARAILIAQGDAVDDPGALGDGLMLQNYYPLKDRAEIQKLLGSSFTETLVSLSPGQWHRPIWSGFGVRLVYLHSVNEPSPPVFSEVRERVIGAWRLARGEERNDQFYTSLREQYSIIIETPEDEIVFMQEPSG